jgi:SSS family solute:Na+ symporter
VVLCVLSLLFWTKVHVTIVDLLLIGYNGVTQFFPGVVLAFVWRKANAWGVGSGIVAGIAVVVYASAHQAPVVAGINVGFFALACNALVCAAVSLLTARGNGVREGGQATAAVS